MTRLLSEGESVAKEGKGYMDRRSGEEGRGRQERDKRKKSGRTKKGPETILRSGERCDSYVLTCFCIC